MLSFEEMYACEQLLRRFALLNDEGDHEGLARLFTEDGSFVRPSAPDAPVHGRAAILQAFRARPARFARHVVANVVIDGLASDRARARSCIVLYAADATDGAPPYPATGPVLVGGFDDQLVKVDGRWLFRSRRGSLALKTG